MTCEELLRRLAEYGDRALSEELCREVDRHLRDCHPCGELQHDLESLRRLCRCDKPAAMPTELRQRIARMLQRSEPGGQ